MDDERTCFRTHVLAWLQQNGHPDAFLVEHVPAYGSDWNGSTDHGFYPSFGVTIEWYDATGKEHRTAVRGSDMRSLWRWVVTGFDGLPVTAQPQ